LTPEEKLNELAAYRLRQAEESLDEAAYLLAGGKSPRAVINRAYYSMFYAVLALLIYEEFASSKHTGVIAWFNRNYIKTGKFPMDPGIYFNKAFELRQRGDYREQAEPSRETVVPYLDKARDFIDRVKEIITLL
jgi:hypothetical protein